MRAYRPGDLVRGGFTTSHPLTKAPANADSLPTLALNRNGTVDGSVTVTVTNYATGRYRYNYTIPYGYVAGDDLFVEVNAVVAGVSGGNVLGSIRLVAPNFATSGAGGLPVLASLPVPLAYYPLDGALTDASGNGHTLIGTALFAPGRFGQGVYTLGGSEIPRPTAPGPIGSPDVKGPWSLSFWVFYGGGGGDVLWQDDTSDEPNDLSGYGFGPAENQARFQSVTINGPELTAGHWHHIAIVADGSQGRLYVDGSLVGSPANISGNSGTLSGEFAIKGGGGGPIDDVAVFNVALTAAQVALIASGLRYGLGGTVLSLTGGSVEPEADALSDATAHAAWNAADRVLTVSGNAAVADKLLGRTASGGADGGRTVAYHLQGGPPKIILDVPGPGQYTVYASDDITPIGIGVYARGPNSLGPMVSLDPSTP